MTVGVSAIVASHLGLSNGQFGQNGPGEIVAFFLPRGRELCSLMTSSLRALFPCPAESRSADCSSRTLATQHPRKLP